MTFIDGGANEGVYTLFAAARVGSNGAVWAFEPSRRELARLNANIDVNRFSVRVLPIALADFSGEGRLTIAGYEHEGQNTLGAFAYEGVDAIDEERVQI